ncbi:MAG: hypothetical protein RLZ94_555, partial [Actinomycetota bacterium]
MCVGNELYALRDTRDLIAGGSGEVHGLG